MSYPPYLPNRLLDWFNKAVFKEEVNHYTKCKIGIFSQYGDGIEAFDADHVIEEPVMVGELDTMDPIWLTYQKKAEAINKQNYDYNLATRNCHTVNAALNNKNISAVAAFAKRGALKLGANPKGLIIPEISADTTKSLSETQENNALLAYKISTSHRDNALNI